MKKRIIFVVIISVILDRISKLLVINNLYFNIKKTVIKDVFYLTYVENDGAAWSILKGNTLLLIAISFIVLIVLFTAIIKEKNVKKIDTISYGLIIGGIIGNLSDRLYLGSVIDFIGINIFGYPFPIFNIADTSIVIGIIIAIITVFRGEKNENNSTKG